MPDIPAPREPAPAAPTSHVSRPDSAIEIPPHRPEPEDDTSGGGRRRLLWAVAIILILAAPAFLYLAREKWMNKKEDAIPMASSQEPDFANVATNSPPSFSPPVTPTAPKSLDDLKVGAITLEKAKGSSLVYAVGILRNNSDYQRFGVNIEVELTDSRGNKAGVAKDYRQVIEPRQEWRFRALVLDSRAVSAKLSSIREED